MRYFLLPLLAIAIFSACQSDSKSASSENVAWSAEYEAVMAVHDEVMPKLKDITKAVGKLKDIDTENLSAENQELHGITNKLLTNAETGMWDWMHAFKKKKELNKMSEADVNSYLEDQMVKVKKVKFDINNSLDAYELFMQKVNTKE